LGSTFHELAKGETVKENSMINTHEPEKIENEEKTECIMCHKNHNDTFKHPWGIIGFIQRSSIS